ncbi:MAG TPA: carboxypeptidase-like regulatory domain-containing protein [Candidatus Udaeobacter sp.]|nr:carboxypeptidase-like regulatory domain-containing protein [Candidatus Udaeobacter sp.]
MNRLIRGHVTEVFQVYEGNDSGRATFDWKTGRKYLLFLFYSASEKSWALDGCGNSGPFDSAKSALEQIDAIQNHNDSRVIHGTVSDQTLAAPFLGVRVEARGSQGLYKTTTNSKGEFEIKVPAGRYTVRATKAGRSFDTADFSYENPQDLTIEPGGCVQVQLVAH